MYVTIFPFHNNVADSLYENIFTILFFMGKVFKYQPTVNTNKSTESNFLKFYLISIYFNKWNCDLQDIVTLLRVYPKKGLQVHFLYSFCKSNFLLKTYLAFAYHNKRHNLFLP